MYAGNATDRESVEFAAWGIQMIGHHKEVNSFGFEVIEDLDYALNSQIGV